MLKRDDRPAMSFQPPHTLVVIHADNEPLSQGLGFLQAVDVMGSDQVKTSVCPDDPVNRNRRREVVHRSGVNLGHEEDPLKSSGIETSSVARHGFTTLFPSRYRTGIGSPSGFAVQRRAQRSRNGAVQSIPSMVIDWVGFGGFTILRGSNFGKSIGWETEPMTYPR